MNYGVNLKNFFVVIYIPPLEAASFESTLRKKSYPKFKKEGENLLRKSFMRSTPGANNIKNCTLFMMEDLARDKHSSLLQKIVNFVQKFILHWALFAKSTIQETNALAFFVQINN